MIKSIKNYFEDLFNEQSIDPDRKEKNIELATAVLMIEISLADDHMDDSEHAVIQQLLYETFAISKDEIHDLIDAAKKEVDHAVSLYDFTRLLNESLTMTERINIIKNLWRVAYADSVVDKYEEYYIRKVTDLLYVDHADYIKAKLDAAG